MHNAPKPNIEDLPSKAQLLRSAVIATVGAVAIGVMVYLPAEYGKDPTGVGDMLGLTQMGVIKQQLAAEAAEDEVEHGSDKSSSLMDEVLGFFAPAAYSQEARKDEITFALEPGASFEIKATMEKGATLNYAWVATGGRINFDLHAHSGDDKVTYEKGRGETSGEGSFETPFAGNHGWFWRNRDNADVTVKLQLRGDYSELVRSR